MFLRAPLLRLSRGLLFCATIALTTNTHAQDIPIEDVPIEVGSNEEKDMQAMEAVRSFFLANPSGALISPMLSRLADLKPSIDSFGRFRHIFLPAIRAIQSKAHKKITEDLTTARRKVKHNSTRTLEERVEVLEVKQELSKDFSLILENWQKIAEAHFDKHSFQEVINQAKTLTETELCRDLKAHWMEAGRVAGFSNSMSEHPAGHGLDLGAAVKLVPRGPSFLYGQDRESFHGKARRPVMEMDRHHGGSNPDVKMANWGNIFSKVFQVPLHRGYQPFINGNYSGAAAEILAHRDEIGLIKLYEDAQNEAIEASRGVFWVFYLLGEGETTLAYDAFIKAIGDMNASSRRLRKLIQLLPNGSFWLYSFQNLASLPLFALDFNEGYLETIQAMWASLAKQQPGTSAYYAQMMTLTNKVFEPAIGSLYLLVYGFGNKPRTGWAMSRAHHTYNLIQYVTYALPQLLNHYKSFADSALDKVGLTHDSSYRLPVTAASVIGSHLFLVAVYNGRMGERPQHAVRTYAPYAVKVLLIDTLSSSVLTTALGRPINLIRSVPATAVLAILAGARNLAGGGIGGMRALPLFVGALAYDFRDAAKSLWQTNSPSQDTTDEL